MKFVKGLFGCPVRFFYCSIVHSFTEIIQLQDAFTEVWYLHYVSSLSKSHHDISDMGFIILLFRRIH